MYRNKGAGGVDGIKVDALRDLLKRNGKQYIEQIEQGKYVAQPILGVELEQSGNHEYRLKLRYKWVNPNGKGRTLYDWGLTKTTPMRGGGGVLLN